MLKQIEKGCKVGFFFFLVGWESSLYQKKFIGMSIDKNLFAFLQLTTTWGVVDQFHKIRIRQHGRVCCRPGVCSLAPESNLATTCFSVAMSLKYLERIKRRMIVYGMLKLYKIQILVSINKVYWDTAHSFTYCISATENLWPAKLKIFIIWLLQKKFAHLALDDAQFSIKVYFPLQKIKILLSLTFSLCVPFLLSSFLQQIFMECLLCVNMLVQIWDSTKGERIHHFCIDVALQSMGKETLIKYSHINVQLWIVTFLEVNDIYVVMTFMRDLAFLGLGVGDREDFPNN